MSAYERRYGVHANRTAHYTDDPTEALALFKRGLVAAERFGYDGPAWIDEGYGDYSDGPNDTICVTRRTIRNVLPSELEFIIERTKVQKMLAELGPSRIKART